MIRPMIHQWLNRSDLARLVAAIAEVDSAQALVAARALEAGRVDALLDSPAALEAVRGRGGAPAPLALPLLWYIPIRAALCQWGVQDIELADYAATLPVAFVSTRAVRRIAKGETGLSSWSRVIEALPGGSVARAEGAAYCGALALWWAGCFPEYLERRGGAGMVRAYVDFAATALGMSADVLQSRAPRLAELYARAADQSPAIRDALGEARRDYLGPQAHTAEGRLNRFLDRLDPKRAN